MDDYLGAFDNLEAALRAVSDGIDWAEVATVRKGDLKLVATGERDGASWLWRARSAEDPR